MFRYTIIEEGELINSYDVIKYEFICYLIEILP